MDSDYKGQLTMCQAHSKPASFVAKEQNLSQNLFKVINNHYQDVILLY